MLQVALLSAILPYNMMGLPAPPPPPQLATLPPPRVAPLRCEYPRGGGDGVIRKMGEIGGIGWGWRRGKGEKVRPRGR